MPMPKSAPSGQPPAYQSQYEVYDEPTGSNWNPKNWPLWAQIVVPIATVAVIAGVVAGAVVGTEDDGGGSSYPDYSALNYSLTKTYSGTDFFDNFDYYSGYDPSSGFVHYDPADVADEYNLTYASATSAILRVDTSQTNASTGRHSVRITTKTQYDTGLFVFDVLHSPYGCGTWPALWLSDPSNWPTNGEIDVMEAVNQATSGNSMTLHTTDDCTMKVKRKETGTIVDTNCWNETDDNAGCGVKGADDTFGEAFNDNGGGIYAMELRDAGIRIWFFDRSSIPDDLSSSNDSSPDPTGWGEALADFPSTDCDISSHFTNQSIIANIDLCGSWAGATSVYSTEDSCPGTCESYVTSNNTAFDVAYWEFASWRVYTAS